MSVSCPGGTRYTVQSGDTLYAIAQRTGVSVTQIMQANPQIVNPDVLQVGQVLCIPSVAPAPPPCPGFLYTIVAGDTLFGLASRFGTTVAEIQSANPGLDPNRLLIGQQICIPSGVAPGARCYPMAPTDLVPQSQGVVYVSPRANSVFTMVSNVPPPAQLPGGRVYKAWLRRRTSGQYVVSPLVEALPGVWITNVAPGYPVQEVESVLVSAEPRANTTVPQGTGVATVFL